MELQFLALSKMPWQKQALGGRDVWVPALLPWELREQSACGFGGLHNATGTASSAGKKQPDKQQLIGASLIFRNSRVCFICISRDLHFQRWDLMANPCTKCCRGSRGWVCAAPTQKESTVTLVTPRAFLSHFSLGGFMAVLGLGCSLMVPRECRSLCSAGNRTCWHLHLSGKEVSENCGRTPLYVWF